MAVPKSRLGSEDLTRYIVGIALLYLTIAVGDAHAGANGMAQSLCTIPFGIINTSLGRGLATMGILIIGIMATIGRITWAQATVVGVGISAKFGAADLAGMIAMNQGPACY